MAQSRGDGHRSLVTPERILSECDKDLIFFIYKTKNISVAYFALMRFSRGTNAKLVLADLKHF